MASHLYSAFLSRYPRAQYAVMEEVCEDVNGVGRRADFMVLSLWRSRGYELQGFEVKSDRGDWLREKAEPSKAEALARYCDRWFIVATKPDVVKADELPPTWGLLELRGKKLVQVVAAPKLTPIERDWGFICSLIRRSQDDARRSDKGMLAEVKEEIRQELIAEAKLPETVKSVARLEEQLAEQQQLISDFNEQAGVYLTKWNLGSILEAVRLVNSIDAHTGAIERMRDLHRRFKEAEKSLGLSLKNAEAALANRTGVPAAKEQLTIDGAVD